MEAKSHSSGGSRSPDKLTTSDRAAGVESGTGGNLIVRFVEYVYKAINEDMDDFFEDNVDVFDQDDEEVDSGKGETFEQYAVYEEYLKQVSERTKECDIM